MNHQTLLNNYLARYLKLNKTVNCNKGFTLIEVLVVVVILGILAAIALPNLLNQVGKARQSEAKTYSGAVNRAQQAYFTERGKFALTLDELGVGIPEKTNDYTYSLTQINKGNGSVLIAEPINTTVKGYLGVSGLINADTNPSVRTAICESIGVGTASDLSVEDTEITEDDVKCVGNSVAVK